jgi:hypothetical protein
MNTVNTTATKVVSKTTMFWMHPEATRVRKGTPKAPENVQKYWNYQSRSESTTGK